jgi:hypothetical protein
MGPAVDSESLDCSSNLDGWNAMSAERPCMGASPGGFRIGKFEDYYGMGACLPTPAPIWCCIGRALVCGPLNNSSRYRAFLLPRLPLQ